MSKFSSSQIISQSVAILKCLLESSLRSQHTNKSASQKSLVSEPASREPLDHASSSPEGIVFKYLVSMISN